MDYGGAMSILSQNIHNLLTDQYNHELCNFARYKARQSYADYLGLNGIAQFFGKEAAGEAEHAEKVFQFVSDRNERIYKVSPNASEEIPQGFRDIFISALEIERQTTTKLNNLATAAMREGDLQTFFWVSDLIKEQTEEENLYQTIIDRIDTFGGDQTTAHLIDTWIGSL